MFLDQEFAAGRSEYFSKASAAALQARADDSAGLYCAKMLRKWGLEGPVYVSAKRTHRFRRRKHGLSDCEANGSDRNCNRFSVGSFWKTNPPAGCFSGFFGRFVRFLTVPEIPWTLKCYEPVCYGNMTFGVSQARLDKRGPRLHGDRRRVRARGLQRRRRL